MKKKAKKKVKKLKKTELKKIKGGAAFSMIDLSKRR